MKVTKYWQPLEEEKVEYGSVFRHVFRTHKTCSSGELMIQPHSKIKMHSHPTNSEIYIDASTGKVVSRCGIGGEHEYANDTDNVQILLYVQANGSLF